MDSKITNYLSSVKEVLSTFDKPDLLFLLKFVAIGEKQNRKSNGLIIIEALVQAPDASAEHIKTLLPEKTTNSAFYKSLSRLKEKIFESLILDINLKRSNELSVPFAQRAAVRKRIMQSFVLFSKGLELDGRKLLEQLMDQAKKYELYDELHEVLHWLRNESGLRYGKKKFDKYTEDMAYYKMCRDAVYEARNLYYDYYIFSDRTSEVQEKIEKVKVVLAQLEYLKDQTNSNQVGYYYYLILSELYTLERNSAHADELAEALFLLLKKAPILKVDVKIGIAHSDVADMMLSCGLFDRAIFHSKRALSKFEKNTYNYFVAQEIRFRALFWQGAYQKAERVLRVEECSQSDFPLVHARYFFYRACLYFEKGLYQKSNQILQDIKLLDKDKYGWNVAMRILVIMNHIESQNFDLADSKISSFRKYIDRLKRNGRILPRYLVISKLLLSLRNQGFNFSKSMKESNSLLEKLKLEEDGYRRAEKSPELIAFHNWFKEKCQ